MNNCTVNSTTYASAFEFLDLLDICVLSIHFLFGLSSHSYIIWLIITGSGIASELFFFSFSVSEIGICINSLMFLFEYCPFFPYITEFIMVFKKISEGVAITGRPLFQCLICVERYLAVIHPLTFLKYKPLRYKMYCSAVAWFMVLGSCGFCIFLYFSPNIYLENLVFVIQFLLFFSIQLFCCLAVLRALKQSGPGERGREREEENHMKRKAFNLIVITTVSTVITYLPYIISGFFCVFTEYNVDKLDDFSFSCFVLAGFVQPFLYLQRAGKLTCLSSP